MLLNFFSVDGNFTVNVELDSEVNFCHSFSTLDAKYFKIDATRHL